MHGDAEARELPPRVAHRTEEREGIGACMSSLLLAIVAYAERRGFDIWGAAREKLAAIEAVSAEDLRSARAGRIEAD